MPLRRGLHLFRRGVEKHSRLEVVGPLPEHVFVGPFAGIELPQGVVHAGRGVHAYLADVGEGQHSARPADPAAFRKDQLPLLRRQVV